MNKGTVYRLWHPDEEKVVGYRWKIETRNTTVVSKMIFATGQSAKKSCENYIEKHDLKIGIDQIDLEVTTDFDFLV